MNKLVSFIVITSILTGCATPAGMVSKREVTATEIQAYKTMNCTELEAKFEDSLRLETTLATEMNKRAGAQLAANMIGVAALAFGGVGFFYTARNEGSRREALSNVRGEVEGLRTAAKEMNCNLTAAEGRVVNPAVDEKAKTETNDSSAPENQKK